MRFVKKLIAFFVLFLCLTPALGRAYTINGNLDVRGGANLGVYSNNFLVNICFKQGADSSQLKITSCNGSALSASNSGFLYLKSATAGTSTLFRLISDVTLDLTGVDFATDTKGDVTGMILRVYAINNSGTLIWGVGYQGGFTYIRNTQDVQTATSTTAPENIYTTVNVTTDNSPMLDVGYIVGSRTDSSNEFAISEYHPAESADGIWQPWKPSPTGFSSAPTITTGSTKWSSFGKTIYIIGYWLGTSNATTMTAIAPIKSMQDSNAVIQMVDNTISAPGRITAFINSTSLIYGKSIAVAGGYTASGLKGLEGNFFLYESYQP